MDDQSAFPHEGGHKFMQGNEVRKTLPSHGMTLRDYFAAKAMQTMLASVYEYEDGEETHSARMRLMAVDAYVTADAMLTERAKPCS